MTKLLIALTLTMAAQAGFAQGFSPWEARLVPPLMRRVIAAGFAQGFSPWEARGVRHQMTSGVAASVAPSGFATWRDRETVIDMPRAPTSRMSDAFGSAFRPWS